MEKSQTITELAKALVKFQSEMKTVVFDASNPFFKSKYATLSTLVTHSKDLLVKHGLAVSQLTEGEGTITTILMHISGEYICSSLTLKPVKDDPQGRGSCITYARRYSYASILGLVSDEDDDGNKATGKKEEKKEEPTNGHRFSIDPPATLTLKDLIEQEGCKRLGNTDKFTAWRIDNNFSEDLDKSSNKELQMIRAKLTLGK